jgi:serine/threonine protein kinase
VFWNSEHVVRIYGVHVSPPSLVMEYAPHGDLASHLRIFGPRLPSTKLCQIAQQVALAVFYLVSMSVRKWLVCVY